MNIEKIAPKIVRAYRRANPSSRAVSLDPIGRNGSGVRDFRCLCCGKTGIGSYSCKWPRPKRSWREVEQHIASCEAVQAAAAALSLGTALAALTQP
jgi:hypothetical protein